MSTDNYNGIGETTVVTLASALERDVDEGKPVKVSASDTIAVAGDGEVFHGVVKAIESDGVAAVALNGLQTLPYTGAAPAAGINKLAGNATGGVKVDDVNGREYLVVSVDITNTLVTIKL